VGLATLPSQAGLAVGEVSVLSGVVLSDVVLAVPARSSASSPPEFSLHSSPPATNAVTTIAATVATIQGVLLRLGGP